MGTRLEGLAGQYGLSLCVECGKCVAVCPMGEIFADFTYEVSPRGVVEWSLLGTGELDYVGLWVCLACDLCTGLCPAGVRFRDYVEAARQLAIESGITSYGSCCRGCGKYLQPRHTSEYLLQALGEGAEELLTLCPECRRYDLGEKAKTLLPASRRVGSRQARTGESP